MTLIESYKKTLCESAYSNYESLGNEIYSFREKMDDFIEQFAKKVLAADLTPVQRGLLMDSLILGLQISTDNVKSFKRKIKK